MYTENKQKQLLHKMAENDRTSNPTNIFQTCFVALCIVMIFMQLDIKGIKYANSSINQQSNNHTEINDKNDRLLAIYMNRQDQKLENGANIDQERQRYHSSQSSSTHNINITNLQTHRKSHKKNNRNSLHRRNLKLYITYVTIKVGKVFHLNGELHSSKTGNKSMNNEFPSKWEIGSRLNIMHIRSNQKQVSQKRHKEKVKKPQLNSNLSQYQNKRINMKDFLMLKSSLHRPTRVEVKDVTNPIAKLHLANYNRIHIRYLIIHRSIIMSISNHIFPLMKNSILIIQRYPAIVLSLIHTKKITICWSPYIMIQSINLTRNIVIQSIKYPSSIKKALNDSISYNAEQSITSEEHEQFSMLNLLSMEELSRTLPIRENHLDDLQNNCSKGKKRRGVFLRYVNTLLSMKIRHHGSHLSSLIKPIQSYIINARTEYLAICSNKTILEVNAQNIIKEKIMRELRSITSILQIVVGNISVQRYQHDASKDTCRNLTIPANSNELKILLPSRKIKPEYIIGLYKKFGSSIQFNITNSRVNIIWKVIMITRSLDRISKKGQGIYNDPKILDSGLKTASINYGRKNREVYEYKLPYNMQKSDQLMNTSNIKSESKENEIQESNFPRNARYHMNRENSQTFNSRYKIFLLKERNQSARSTAIQKIHIEDTMIKKRPSILSVQKKWRRYEHSTNTCDHNYGLKKWKMSTKHNGPLYNLPPSKITTSQISRITCNDNSNNKQYGSYYELRSSQKKSLLHYSSQIKSTKLFRIKRKEISNQVNLHMPSQTKSTRSRGRPRKARSMTPEPKVSNNNKATMKTKSKSKVTTFVTPNKKKGIRGKAVISEITEAITQEMMHDDDASNSNDDSSSDGIIDLSSKDVNEQDNNNMNAEPEESDEELRAIEKQLNTPFRSTATQSPPTSPSDESNCEATASVTSTETSPTTNTEKGTQNAISRDLQDDDGHNHTANNNESALQASVNQAVQNISPQEKIRLMVLNARKKAQAQSKMTQSKISDTMKSTSTTKSRNMVESSSTVVENVELPSNTKQLKPKSKKKVKKSQDNNRYSTLQDSDSENESVSTNDSYYDDDSCISENSKDSKNSGDNRRNGNRSNSPKRSETLVQQSLRPHNRIHHTLLTLKLKVKKHKDPVKELMNRAKSWMKAVQIIDPTMVLYEYHSAVKTTSIASPKKIPTEITAFKKYFSGANPQTSEGHAWCQIWMGHDEPMTNIRASMQGWSSDHDTQMYVKRLQHKDTVREYWLLWSSQKIDTEVLYEAAAKALKTLAPRYQPHFAFMWAVIRKEKGKYSKNETIGSKGQQYVKALHIEVPRDEKETTYALLSKIFGSKRKECLLGRELRMVPAIRKESTGYIKQKIIHLIEKQEKYLATLSATESYDLNDIDYVHSSLNMSLRQMIMGLKTLRTFNEKDEPIPIFLSIDAVTWPQDAHALSYPTHLADEAQEYISSLPSFLHWCYGDDVLDMLNISAVRKAREAPWDPEQMRAITPESMELDAIEAEAVTFAPWVMTEDVVQINNITTVTNDFMFQRATDADSVSTFNTKKSNRSESGDEDNGTRISKRAKKAQKIIRAGVMNTNHRNINATNNLASTNPDENSEMNLVEISSGAGNVDNSNEPPGHESVPGGCS